MKYSANKATYLSSICYFESGAFPIWLSYFVFPSSLEDGLNNYGFAVAILLAKGERLALAPLYLASLSERLDECVNNIVRSGGRYDVATYADALFLQMSIWERLGLRYRGRPSSIQLT